MKWQNSANPTIATRSRASTTLVAEERELRERVQHGDLPTQPRNTSVRLVEAELDQCWDLLRQRRALRETGGDPREARCDRPARSRAI